MTMLRWAMGVNVLGYRRNESLEEARVELIAMATRRRRLEWFRKIRRRYETENIRAVVERKLAGNRPGGKPMLRPKTLSEGTRKPGTSGRNGTLTGRDGTIYSIPAK